jgi:DNA-binding Lrp family transcriptional regulator
VNELKDTSMVPVEDTHAQIEAETLDELKQVLGQRIRRMEDVRSTITMLVSARAAQPNYARISLFRTLILNVR